MRSLENPETQKEEKRGAKEKLPTKGKGDREKQGEIKESTMR